MRSGTPGTTRAAVWFSGPMTASLDGLPSAPYRPEQCTQASPRSAYTLPRVFTAKASAPPLLDALVSASAAGGFWTLQASIFPENEASIALHCKHGFRIVGRRERIAQLHGIWRDTILMERRSPNQWSSATASPVPRA